MNRRDALTRVAWLTGGVVIGANLFLEGCSGGTGKTTKNIESLFEPSTIDFLGDLADTILPPTKSPGAKEAGVGAFMPLMVRDCYTKEEQLVFMEGIGKLEEASKTRYQRNFQGLNPKERTELLLALDREMVNYKKNKKPGQPDHYFDLFKQLTLLGFFTSELGATKALRYVQIPGRYDGNFPYQKGDRAWAI